MRVHCTYICLYFLDKIHEDMCGFEEITKKADPIEYRPWGPSYVNITMRPPDPDRSQETQIIIAGWSHYCFGVCIS